MHALCSRFYQLCSKLQLVGDCKESSTIMQFTPPEIRKQHTILLGIYSGCSNTKISQCLTVDLKTVQKMWKELNKSNGDYKGTTTWEFHFDNKRTSEFLGKISTMIDSKSIRSIARDMEMSAFLIRQVVHEDVISYARWERDTFYSCSVSTRCTNTDENETVHMGFGVATSDGDIMPPFIFLHGLSHNRSLQWVPGRDSAALDWKGSCWKTVCLTTGLYHSTQARESRIS